MNKNPAKQMSDNTKEWLLSLLVVIISFIIFCCISFWFSGRNLLSSAKQEENDLHVFNERLMYNMPIEQKNEDICIVSIDNLDRDGIARTISGIAALNPSAIGLDVCFPSPGLNDSLLIDALDRARDRIVFSLIGYDYDYNREAFNDIKGSFFDSDYLDCSYGLTNFGTDEKSNSVNRYVYKFRVGDYSFDSFGYALAKIHSDQLKVIDSESESLSIRYKDGAFQEIPASLIIDGSLNKSYIENKIVLVGALEDPSDIHYTIVDKMPGVYVHAYAINSILHRKEDRSMPLWLDLIISFVISLLFTRLLVYGKKHLGDSDNLFIRILQFIMLILIYAIGAILYCRYCIESNWLILFSLIALNALIFDIVIGLVYLYKRIIGNRKR